MKLSNARSRLMFLNKSCTAPAWIGFLRKKGRVLHASGPWRSSGDWWDAVGEWKRDEWDVHIALDGCAALYRVFRDLATRAWFVEGIYD